MPRIRRNQDRISWTQIAGFTVDLHGPLPFEDEVELFAELVVVAVGRLAHGNRGLSETLILHRRVGAVQNTADGAAILGGERRLLGKLVEGHAAHS